MLLSNPFLPDPRVEKEAKALTEAGYEVIVLAWGRGGGKANSEKQGEVLIRRINTDATTNVIDFVVNYARFFYKAIFVGAKARLDIVHAHDFDTLLLGVIISKLRRSKLVYDAHEHYAMMIRRDGGESAAKLVDRMERRLVGEVDLLIAANEHIQMYLQPHIFRRAVVVMNCVEVGVTFRDRPPPSARVRIFYAGSLEPQRYILELLDAVKADDRTELKIAGRGRYEEEVRKGSQSCSRIEFLGFISPAEVLAQTSASDVVFSMLDPSNENYRIATPIKVLEAMAMGVPVLVSRGTWSANIVERTESGLVLDWSEEYFREAIGLLMDPKRRQTMGENGRKAAESEFNWKNMKDQLVSAYAQL
jgi:glycosyltransferase involved in cell wall biosynthesis